MTDAEQLWELCAEALRGMVSEAAWRMWFTQVSPSWADEHRLVLTVPSALARERLQAGYLEVITEVVEEVAGNQVSVEFVVRAPASDVDDSSPRDDDDSGPLPVDNLGTTSAELLAGAGPPGGRTARGGLRENYTFDAFITADSNRFARAAAGVVAETPGLAYNPLVIFGGSGLGKTHLLHAIGNYVLRHFPDYTVRYTPTEACMNEFVEALRTKTTLAFKRRYRECDVLLLDDFQFVMTSERLGEEFFYTFNELQEASKQIVIVSDRPPAEMGQLHERFRSRLQSGLVTDIKPPDLETRIAILRKKAEHHLEVVPDEVFVLIATQIRDNIRELEGALTQVVAFARHHEEPLTAALAEKVMSEMASTRPRPITPELVILTQSALTGFSVEDLKGPSRTRPLVQARQVGMYVCREMTDLSYPAIAREYGGRDHTTVIHAVEKISAQMRTQRPTYDQVTELVQTIRAEA